MPCGKRPLVKNWDKPRNIKFIKPSPYEQTLDCVKEHWQTVIRDLELSYKDAKFWESNCDTVRELVGPIIFQRIAKIFELPADAKEYEPGDQYLDVMPSEQHVSHVAIKTGFSTHTDFEWAEREEAEAEHAEEESHWTESTITPEEKKTATKLVVPKAISKILSKSFSLMRGASSHVVAESFSTPPSEESSASSSDDIQVRAGSSSDVKRQRQKISNPYFDMLYCNKSETDMIKWNSKYKQKTVEVSASDEFSKRAEILTKKISAEFYEWWVGLGNVEFKSEIKRPEDIETLFQVWFDEHSSRGIMLDPRIIPCVLRSVAVKTGVQRASCIKALRRQIAYDVHAETSPAHTGAFGTSLPNKLKHIPPKNNTYKQWRSVEIPDDLRTMACVWEDIQHLTSTKAFQQWLGQHPHMPMPPFFKQMDTPGDKKQLFVVPSDYILKEKGASATSAPELALPVSQFSLELKEVLSKLMDT